MTKSEQVAEYVAVPYDYCIAHHGMALDGVACNYSDCYNTPCVWRQLYYRTHNDGSGAAENT